MERKGLRRRVDVLYHLFLREAGNESFVDIPWVVKEDLIKKLQNRRKENNPKPRTKEEPQVYLRKRADGCENRGKRGRPRKGWAHRRGIKTRIADEASSTKLVYARSKREASQSGTVSKRGILRRSLDSTLAEGVTYVTSRHPVRRSGRHF